MPRTPTFFQRFWASHLPVIIWVVPWWIVATLKLLEFLGDSIWYGWTWLWLLLFLPCTIVVSHVLAMLIAWPVIGSILSWRSESNGGPFSPGDTVQILRGPHTGKVVKVYENWQDGSVRVRLGAEAEKSFKDVFVPSELLRESPPSRPAAEPAEQQ